MKQFAEQEQAICHPETFLLDDEVVLLLLLRDSLIFLHALTWICSFKNQEIIWNNITKIHKNSHLLILEGMFSDDMITTGMSLRDVDSCLNKTSMRTSLDPIVLSGSSMDHTKKH